jgi:hypothetical protein
MGPQKESGHYLAELIAYLCRYKCSKSGGTLGEVPNDPKIEIFGDIGLSTCLGTTSSEPDHFDSPRRHSQPVTDQLEFWRCSSLAVQGRRRGASIPERNFAANHFEIIQFSPID